MVVFLIDADNLNSVDWIDEAFLKIEKLGQKIDIRRAYGSTANLSALTPILLKRAIVAMHNVALTKNTTDVALAVDAMWFSLQVPMPSTIVIGSGDADFVPLVARLRERRIRLIGVSGPGKMSKEVMPWYDDVLYVGEEDNKADAAIRVVNAHRVIPASSATSTAAAVPCVVAKPAVVATAATTPAQKAAIVRIDDDVMLVKRILAEIPGWLPNTVKQLNQIGKPLREAGVKKGNSPLHDLFAKYPAYFKVLPVTGPAKQIRLLKRP